MTSVNARVGKEYEIRALGTILLQMAELALLQMGEPVEPKEAMSLRDLFGASLVSNETGAKVIRAIDKLIAQGDVTKRQKWQALACFADAILGET